MNKNNDIKTFACVSAVPARKALRDLLRSQHVSFTDEESRSIVVNKLSLSAAHPLPDIIFLIIRFLNKIPRAAFEDFITSKRAGFESNGAAAASGARIINLLLAAGCDITRGAGGV